MPVTSTNAYSGPFTVSGTDPVSFDFQAASADEILVTLDGVELSADDYTVELNGDDTGTVTPTGTWSGEVYVYSNPDFRQNADWGRFAPYFPDQLVPPLDRLTKQQITLKDKIDRAPQLPVEGGVEGLFPVVLPGGTFGFSSGTGADAGLRQDLADLLAGASIVAFNAGAGADPSTVEEELKRTTFATVYGFKSTNDDETNKAALKKAIAATPVGGILRIGNPGQATVFDTAELDDAPDINKSITVQFEGTIQANSGVLGVAKPYMFKVSADDVTFCGSGILMGDGTINDLNTGDVSTFPGLVYVTGANFRCRNLIFDTPPKLSVLLVGAGADGAQFTNVTFRGGPVDYTIGNTAYFGVVATGNERHIFFGCRFMRNAAGGRPITGIFCGGLNGNSDGNMIIGCFADVHEKLAYIYGDRNLIALNQIVDAIRTDVVRLHGSYNRLVLNHGDNIKGLCQVFDGTDNDVMFNYFTRIQQNGVSVQYDPAYTYTGGLHRQRIIGNVLYADTASTNLADAIVIYASDGNDADDCQVTDNVLDGFAPEAGDNGLATIRVQGVNPQTCNRPIVDRNYISNTQFGIRFERCLRYSGSFNRFSSLGVGGYPITTANGAYGTFIGSLGLGGLTGGIGINGIGSTDFAILNRWTDASLTFTATLENGETETITVHGGIASNATLVWNATNPAARLAVVSNGLPAIEPAGGDVRVTHESGNPATAQQTYTVTAFQ